jgi:hypothetical protein
MTTQGFVTSHAKDAEFERGLRSFYQYRDLGIKKATEGRVDHRNVLICANRARHREVGETQSIPRNSHC